MKMNVILIIAWLFLGCHKESPVIPINPCLNSACDTSKLEIVWQRPIGSDTAELGSVRPLFWDSKVLFSQTFHEPDALNCYDSKSGELIWSWADYFLGRATSNSNPTGEGTLLKQNKILFTTWNDVYCVESQTGKTIWRTKTEVGGGYPTIRVLDNYVYHVRQLKANNSTIKSHLIRADINIGKWDTIYAQPKIGGFEPYIEPPSVSWKNSKGEEIIFFQIRYVNFSFTDSIKGRIDWLAFNLATQKEEYRFNSIDRGQIGNSLEARQYGDNIYFLCINSLFCINKNDGKILWQKNFAKDGETFTSASPFVAESKLLIKPDNKTLYALDPSTGNQIWADIDNSPGAGEMIYYNGLVYYTCDGDGKIYAIEPSTGKKIWAEPSPNNLKNKFNGNKVFSKANIGFGGVAIDSTLGYIYTSDFYFIMCLKLPKR
jgi:outer membrane protein assembly factor BamB